MRQLLLGLLLGLLWSGAVARADEPQVFAHPLDAAQFAALLGPAAKPLAAAPGLRGRFQQRKYLPDLPKPLLSGGEFLFARDLGVWWHTLTPFDSVFILTGSGMRLRDEGDAETRVSAAQQPGVAVAARIFFALFALDFEALARDFEIFGMAQAGDAWSVGLRPRQAVLASVFREATIDGAQHAQRIELRDAHGGRTEILLPELSPLGAGLSAAERQRFAN